MSKDQWVSGRNKGKFVSRIGSEGGALGRQGVPGPDGNAGPNQGGDSERQRHAGEAEAEFLQRKAARDRLSHTFGQFIEYVLHIFPFICWRPHFAVAFVYVCFSIGCYFFQQ